MRSLHGGAVFLFGSAVHGKEHVFLHGSGEEQRVLRHVGDQVSQSREVDLFDGDAVHDDGSGIGTQQAQQQIGHGGLAGACGAQDQQAFAVFQVKAAILDGGLVFFRIGAGDLVEAQFLDLIRLSSARPVGVEAGKVLHFLQAVDVHEGLFARYEELRQIEQRIDHHAQVGVEHVEGANADPAFHSHVAAEDYDADLGKVVDVLVDQAQYRVQLHHAHLGFEAPGEGEVEEAVVFFLAHKGFHDADAGKAHLQLAVDLADGLLVQFEIAVELVRGEIEDHHHQRQRRYRKQG